MGFEFNLMRPQRGRGGEKHFLNGSALILESSVLAGHLDRSAIDVSRCEILTRLHYSAAPHAASSHPAMRYRIPPITTINHLYLVKLRGQFGGLKADSTPRLVARGWASGRGQTSGLPQLPTAS